MDFQQFIRVQQSTAHFMNPHTMSNKEHNRTKPKYSSFIQKFIPSKQDQFREGTDSEEQKQKYEAMESKIVKYKVVRIKKSHRKHRKEGKKQNFIEISSGDQDIDHNKMNNKNYPSNKKYEDPSKVISIVDLDQQQIEYLKEKLKLTIKKESDIKQGQSIPVNEEVKKFVPPADVKKIPKFIYEYPPYPLGPTDTWPPKYPNSWRSFKMQMKQIRKLN